MAYVGDYQLAGNDGVALGILIYPVLRLGCGLLGFGFSLSLSLLQLLGLLC